MDHRYIDEKSIAERYLEHALARDEQDAFESHMVDCEECTDRLLLAQIFLEHKWIAPPPPAPLPKRAQYVAQTSPWTLLLIAMVAALLLLLIPTTYFLYELARLSATR